MTRSRLIAVNWRDPANPLAGGAETHVWNMLRPAVEAGWRVTAIVARFPGCRKLELIDGIEVIRCGEDWRYYAILPWKLVREIAAEKPALVIEFINKLPCFTPLYVRTPVAVFVHHLFGDAAHFELPFPGPAIMRTLEALIPFGYRRTPVLTGSPSSARELIARGIAAGRTRVAPYGVDVRQFEPGPRSRDPEVLYLGRLMRYKGVDHLLRAFATVKVRVPNARLNIAGEGKARRELERLSAKLDLESAVEFHGEVSEVVRTQLMQQAWTTVLPSFKEGFGLTIAEAALCETPSIGFDVPGINDAIDHPETGLLVPYGSVSVLADAIVRLLTREDERRLMGIRARCRFLNFTWESSANQFWNALGYHKVAQAVEWRSHDEKIDLEPKCDGERPLGLTATEKTRNSLGVNRST